MRKLINKMAILGCAVALCIPMAILAQTADPTPTDPNRNTMDMDRNTAGSTTVTGKVISTDASTLVVETDSGSRMTFDTSGNTLPYGAKVGSRVEVAYTQGQTGSLNRISTVTIVPDTGTATADARYGTPSTMGSMDTNRTVTTNTDNPDLYASNRNLPKTASLMPLLGMLGIFALAAGVAVRIVRLVS